MKRVALLAGAIWTVLLLGCAAAATQTDDPGPHLRYGGTPIELHYEAPGANVTKMTVDGTPCIIVSDYTGDSRSSPMIALSCDWSPR